MSNALKSWHRINEIEHRIAFLTFQPSKHFRQHTPMTWISVLCCVIHLHMSFCCCALWLNTPSVYMKLRPDVTEATPLCPFRNSRRILQFPHIGENAMVPLLFQKRSIYRLGTTSGCPINYISITIKQQSVKKLYGKLDATTISTF